MDDTQRGNGTSGGNVTQEKEDPNRIEVLQHKNCVTVTKYPKAFPVEAYGKEY